MPASPDAKRVTNEERSPLRQGVLFLIIGLAVTAALWTLILLISGGVRLRLGAVSVSSRNPVRPLIATFALIVIARLLGPEKVRRAGTVLSDALSLSCIRTLPPLAAAIVFLVGVAYTGRAAVGADAFGYVSQSLLWARGDARIQQPFAAAVPWPNADWTFAPLGYRPAENHTLVPTYAPGLPLLMAGARRLTRCGPFLVAPACGALLVWCTWRLGRRVFNDRIGTTGAVLVAASPLVLVSTVAPMSDVPAAALWTAALLAADIAGVSTVALAGALAGAAILIRPNLAPLALFPPLLAAVNRRGPRHVITLPVVYTATLAPFVLFNATVNASLYGSPLVSGYGDLGNLFAVRHLATNATRYASWWSHAHGPLGWLFVLSFVGVGASGNQRRVRVLILFALAVVGLYAFYLPYDEWFFLRFMLPAVPVAMLLSAAAAERVSRRFGSLAVTWALVAVTVFAIVRGIHVSRWEGVFSGGDVHQGFADAGRYIDSAAPRRSVVLAMQHSGSVRYYSGRLTVRYDILDAAWLDRSIKYFEESGIRTYAVLEEWEERVFRDRFAGQQAVQLLDAGPMAIRQNPGGQIRVYALQSSSSGVHGQRAVDIPRTSRFHCIDPSADFPSTVGILPTPGPLR